MHLEQATFLRMFNAFDDLFKANFNRSFAYMEGRAFRHGDIVSLLFIYHTEDSPSITGRCSRRPDQKGQWRRFRSCQYAFEWIEVRWA